MNFSSAADDQLTAKIDKKIPVTGAHQFVKNAAHPPHHVNDISENF